MKSQIGLILAFCGLLAARETTVTLDPEEKFNVSWSFEGTSQTSYITFTITCRTTGWVGIGLSPNGDMTNADIMIGWVDSDGSAHLLDMYGTSNRAPTQDTSQDVTLIHADEADGVTMIKFKRKLDTCDGDEDNVVTSSTTRLIYAYKDSDPVNGVIESSDYHGATNRGVKSLYLLESKGVGKPESFPTDALSFDIKINSYNVPAEDTIYYCSFYDPPVLDRIHHVIAIEPLVEKGNEALVHHIVLLGCSGTENEHMRNSNNTEGICSSPEMPEFAESCTSTVYAWAVGGGKFYYPEEVGYPIGGADGTAPQYYMMQVHYDNPQKLDTLMDSSGIRLIYHPRLRDQTAGALPVGLIDGIAVPPLANNFRITGYCDSSCTNQWIPAEGIHLFGFMLHTHLIGRSIQVDWFRGGKHIGVLANDGNYDFNFQEFRHLDSTKTLFPGDTLKITCTYTSNSADQVTYGGEATTEEMCLAYFLYYPKQNLGSCASFPHMLYYANDPVYESLSLNASKEGGMYADIHVLNEVTDWTSEAVAALQDAYEESSHYSLCYTDNDDTYETNLAAINSSHYKSEPKPTEEPCYLVRGNSAPNGFYHSTSVILLAMVLLALVQ